MALSIPIKPVPNQRLNVVLNNQNCTITILTRGSHAFFSLFIDNNPVIQNRKLSITPILPYDYLQEQFTGNMILINNDLNTEEVPEYTKFGVTQSLIYYTADEVA